MAIGRPKKGEFAPFHETYLSAVPRGSLIGWLRRSGKETQLLFGQFVGELENFAYAEGKWTAKQLLTHMIDTERVFAFRALWFLRGDRAPLPGFNQDHWMETTDVSDHSLEELLKEFKAVRESTVLLVKHMTDEGSRQIGTASNWKVSARTMAWCIAGHNLRHLEVLKERYLPNALKIKEL